MRAPKARVKNLGYFTWGQHMTSSFSNYRGTFAPIPWAPAEIFPEGGKSPTLQKVDTFSARRTNNRAFFGAPKALTKIFAFLRRFRLKHRVSSASAVGASENFRVFCRTAAYDVIFSNSRGGASAPPCPPLRAPMAELLP